MTDGRQTDAQPPSGGRRVVIDPVTRVEGHGRVTILLDERGRVAEARLHIVEFRGFERFIQGRLLWEVPVIVQRLCGICPVSHHLAAAKAMDWIVGGERLTPSALKLRRLMHFAQFLQSHAVHFFHLASPDLLLGFDANPAERNVAGLVVRYPEVARRGILLRKYGQEVLERVYGKRIHGTAAIPGGVNTNLPTPARDCLLAGSDDAVTWSRETLQLIRDYTLEHQDDAAGMGTFAASRLCVLDAKAGMEFYDGVLRAVDGSGQIIFDQVAGSDYLKHIAEEVRPWSYMKFPFLRKLGPEKGWYRVGPLARVTTCAHIGTPLAETARSELTAALGRDGPVSSMAYHWARMIEALHAAESIRELLHDPDLQGRDLVVRGERREESVAVLEAPRGTLIHHYRVSRTDQVTMANLIVATTQNNQAMNNAIRGVADRYLDGAELTEGLLNRIEAVIRAYDPCLSCATHAIGSMPLVVEIRDAASDRLFDRRARG